MKKVFTSLLPLMFLIIFSWRLNAQLVTISLGKYLEHPSVKLADGYSYTSSLIRGLNRAWGTKAEISYRVINKNFSIVYETGICKLYLHGIDEVIDPEHVIRSLDNYDRVEFTNYLGFEYRPRMNKNWILRLRASIGAHGLLAYCPSSGEYFHDRALGSISLDDELLFAFKLQALVQLKISAKTAFSFGPHYSYRYGGDRILKHTNAWGAALQFDILID